MIDPNDDGRDQSDPTQIPLPNNVVDFQPWLGRLTRHMEQEQIRLEDAIVTLLEDPHYKGCLAFDSFAGVVRVVGDLPPIPGRIVPPLGPLNDCHVTYIRNAFASLNKYKLSREAAFEAIEAAARDRSYHPLRDYLRGLRWDSQPRLDRWLSLYLGAPDTDYTRAVGRWWIISLIARAFRPGCQADHALVLEGDQGKAKSSAMAILGGEWFLSKLPNVRDYDRAAHALAGRWLVEIGELDAFRGAAWTQVKDFLSLRVDNYRAPYARLPISVERSCVFVGTTNDEHYIPDHTGARRFWPVPVGNVDRRALIANRDQLFAEAVVAYEAGNSVPDMERPYETRWWPDASDAPVLRESINEEQSERQADIDPWEPILALWCKVHDGFTTGDALEHLGIPRERWDRSNSTRVGLILKRLGLLPRKVRENNGFARRYYQ